MTIEQDFTTVWDWLDLRHEEASAAFGRIKAELLNQVERWDEARRGWNEAAIERDGVETERIRLWHELVDAQCQRDAFKAALKEIAEADDEELDCPLMARQALGDIK